MSAQEAAAAEATQALGSLTDEQVERVEALRSLVEVDR